MTDSMVAQKAGCEHVSIRLFNGSLADAEGVLAVEQATFDESPYSPPEVQSMLAKGPQRAWVAVGAGRVVGFVIAFPTYSLRGLSWEVDLLAVLPAWRGRGVATRLIRKATRFGAEIAPQARAFVATDNRASMKAFARVGFRPEPETRRLLVCQPLKHNLPGRPTSGVTFREATSITAATDWLPEGIAQVEPAAQKHSTGRWALLLAELSGQPAGYADLVEVETLLYCGVWIESLVAPNRALCEALVCEIVNQARASGLREIGAMVLKSDRRLQQMLLAGGFKSLGDYYWFTSELTRSKMAKDAKEKQRHA